MYVKMLKSCAFNEYVKCITVIFVSKSETEIKHILKAGE